MSELQLCYRWVGFGKIAKHYFFTLPSQNLSLHLGMYNKGNIMSGTDYSDKIIIDTKIICSDCVELLIYFSDKLDHLWYYPLINCETLTFGFFYNMPISFQICCALLSFGFAISGCLYNVLFTILAIVFCICSIYCNLLFLVLKSISKKKCKHLQNLEEIKY